MIAALMGQSERQNRETLALKKENEHLLQTIQNQSGDIAALSIREAGHVNRIMKLEKAYSEMVGGFQNDFTRFNERFNAYAELQARDFKMQRQAIAEVQKDLFDLYGTPACLRSIQAYVAQLSDLTQALGGAGLRVGKAERMAHEHSIEVV